MGSLNSISNVDMILASTSFTSLVMRDMTSPLRSSVKKPIGKLTTFLYNCARKSRSTPVRIGTMK